LTLVRRPLGVAICVVVLGATWCIATSADAGSQSDARHAASLLRETRRAPARYDFAGYAVVTWSTPKGVERARVRVTDTAGAIEITSADGNTVIDEGRRTYLRDHLGWTGVVVEPTTDALPDPGREWKLATAGARTVAGRPATLVVASRRDGRPAQQIAVDDSTGLLLAREILGPEGDVERSLRFSTVEIGAPAAEVAPPGGVRSRAARPLASTPDGYRAPQSSAGFDLLTRSRHPDGVLFFYSDGLFTASVFEQRGDLDWSALPGGGRDTHLADARTRTYREPSGDVAVWASDGIVYTCVTDAPSDRFEQMVSALSTGERSTVQAVVDFVLGPFGWG
jgi:sigma-E factor negative regulatory protein RseB